MIDRTISRGLRPCSRSTEKPSRSSTPARKFSISTSAALDQPRQHVLVRVGLRSRTSDSLLRLADMKYVDSRSSSAPTNGGPQPRLSSPVGDSTLITRAPMSPSIIAACGPASARVRSSTSRSDSGPSVMPRGYDCHSHSISATVRSRVS